MILDARDLRVRFGRQRVLDGLDLALDPGTLLGLIGSNGAGKSTLLQVLCGLRSPDGGTVRIGGTDLARDPVAAKRLIGHAVPPEALPGGLTGAQYLEFVASARRVPRAGWWAEDLPALLDATPHLHTALRACSLGTRAKFAIAAAMLGDPALVVLDESLNGLDPVASWRLRGVLRARVRAGRSVILASHALETVVALCDRVVMLDRGRIAFDWRQAELDAARADPAAFEDRVMRALLERSRH